MSETKQQKNALSKFWLMVTLLMLMPLGAIIVLVAGIGLTSPAIAGPMVIAVPPPVVQGMVILLLLALWLILAYSLAAVAVSPQCSENPGKAALDALRWTFAYCPSSFALALLMAVLLFVVSEPDELLFPTNFEQYFSGTRNTLILVLSTIWGGVVSVFLWPFTIAPFCELLKDRISGKTDH